ncbi:hypothetical protein T4D_207 [Trichinella pseudospiralis]|uniref:Uncharacterized protein n=1 Tax=Trichinella pseudospiralis TaxID=6337 RepID=A0A0V1FUS2_TRIPS|nr:hypothetical protein T4D_207 [Trichinella pseudospiralis]
MYDSPHDNYMTLISLICFVQMKLSIQVLLKRKKAFFNSKLLCTATCCRMTIDRLVHCLYYFV